LADYTFVKTRCKYKQLNLQMQITSVNNQDATNIYEQPAKCLHLYQTNNKMALSDIKNNFNKHTLFIDYHKINYHKTTYEKLFYGHISQKYLNPTSYIKAKL
jgi:predicted HTH transcriptional regulator